MSLIHVLYKTMHDSKKLSFEQIAERMGLKNPWALYKMVDPTHEYRFPAEWLIPAMKITGNFSPLHYIARQCGFVCVRYSRFVVGKSCDLAKLNELFGLASVVIDRMYREGSIDQTGYDQLYRFFAEIGGHVKTAERIASGQTEFDF